MEQTLFYILAAVAVIATIFAITEKHAVHAIVYLVTSFFALAVVFYLLGAPLVAVFEVIIYAGAIMVLFLFVIMLVNLEEPRRFSGGRLRLALSATLTLLLFGMLASLFARAPQGAAVAASPLGEGNLQRVGAALFTDYLLPFEAVSVLLLVAMIGAIVLGRPRA